MEFSNGRVALPVCMVPTIQLSDSKIDIKSYVLFKVAFPNLVLPLLVL